MTRDLKGELGLKKKQKMKELHEKYRVMRKGLKTVIEEVKQRMLAKSVKVKRYEQRIKQFRQNRISDLHQKKIYTESNRNVIRLKDVPNAEECTKFWGSIWGFRKEHNRGRMVERSDNTADNYQPMTCLPLMWKVLTVEIAEEMYNCLEQENSSRRTKRMEKRKLWNKGSAIDWSYGFKGLQEKTLQCIHGMGRLKITMWK